jgi:hypothetical protein
MIYGSIASFRCAFAIVPVDCLDHFFGPNYVSSSLTA